MDDAQGLSDLTGAIYDTTLDRSLWPGVLKRIADFVHGHSAAVFWKDAANGGFDLMLEDGIIDPHYTELFFTTYAKLDPTTTPRFFAPAETPMSTSDLVPYDEFLRTRFYKEWVAPQGLVDFASVTLEKQAARAATFGVFRHARQGLVDNEMRRRLSLIAPHVKRAVLIAKVVDLKQAEVDTLAEALDGLRPALFFVDAEGRVMHANAAGHALASHGGVLRVLGGRLVTAEAAADAKLRETCAIAARGDVAVGGKGIALPLVAADGTRYVVHVLPLGAGARHRAARRFAATAAIVVHKAALESEAPPVALAAAFSLTLAETRVLFAIVEVGGVPDVADLLGVATSTVKTHLSSLYAKTGASRQADLVKLVAAYASPLLA